MLSLLSSSFFLPALWRFLESGWVMDLLVLDRRSCLEIFTGPIASLFFAYCCLYVAIRSIVGMVRSLLVRGSSLKGSIDMAAKKQGKQPRPSFTATQLCSCLYVTYLAYLIATHKTGIDKIIIGTDPSMLAVLSMCPLINSGPHPPFFLNNRHMQFIPWMLQNEFHRGSIPFETHNLTVHDCLVKTLGCVPDPSFDEEISIDVFPPFSQLDFPSDAPIMIIAPGLRCHSQDLPGNTVLRVAYGAGIRSAVVNRRGHHPSPKILVAPRFSVFGDVDDLEQAYWHIRSLAPASTPLFLHGISSGAAVVVRSISVWDKRRLESPSSSVPSFVASSLLSPGFDTSKVFLPSRFKWPYNPLMNDAVKKHFVLQNEAVLRRHNDSAVDKALGAKTMQEFLEATAPFTGFETAEMFYDKTNPVQDIEFITTPIYVINSVDDPCCDVKSIFEKSRFESKHRNETYAGVIGKTERGLLAIANTGSHCPFLDGGYTNMFVKDPLFAGSWFLNSWADQSLVEFYQAALKVYGDRRFM